MNRLFTSVLCGVWLFAFGSPLHARQVEDARDTLRVGDPRVDGSFIEGFSVTWRATPRDANGVEGRGNWIRETVTVVEDSNGTELLRFDQTWEDTLGNILFVTSRVADRRSMAYRAFQTGRTPGGVAHLDITGQRVRGFYAPRPEAPVIDYALVLDETVFASLGGLLLAAVDHETGLQGVLPGFGFGGTTNPNVTWQRFELDEVEVLSIPGAEEVETWRIETSRSPGTEVVYWVSKQAPYFLRAESRRSDGSRTVFEIDSWTLGNEN